VRYGTETTPSAERARTAFQLPLVSESDISQVTDSLVCAQAAAAQYPSSPDHAVLVFKVGSTRYVVFDKTTGPSEFEGLAVYNASFVYLTSISM
jgi:hypothetical protein